MINQQPADLRITIVSTLAEQAGFNTAQLEDGVLMAVKETGLIYQFDKATNTWTPIGTGTGGITTKVANYAASAGSLPQGGAFEFTPLIEMLGFSNPNLQTVRYTVQPGEVGGVFLLALTTFVESTNPATSADVQLSITQNGASILQPSFERVGATGFFYMGGSVVAVASGASVDFQILVQQNIGLLSTVNPLPQISVFSVARLGNFVP